MTVGGLLIVLVDAFHFMAVFFNKINFTCRLLDLLSCQNITDKAAWLHRWLEDLTTKVMEYRSEVSGKIHDGTRGQDHHGF